MHLFIDTETSGLPDFKLPPDHPSQPHIVSLAAWLGDWWPEVDEMRHVASLNVTIRPHGYHFDPAAVRVHGITEEYAHAFGEEADVALTRLFTLIEQACASEGDALIVAHNFSFDHRMILREMAHIGMDTAPLGTLRPFCTMRALTLRMKLPHKSRNFPGTDRYKWPRLDEAYAYVFNGALVPGREDRHDAMVDTLACKDIFVEGKRREWWP